MATIDEIAPDVFRVTALTDPARDFSTSCFLIRDEQPTLVETGFRTLFAETWDALARVIDPGTLRFVVVPHVEADECGALNAFLDRSPHAIPVCSPVGVVTNLRDFAVRDPLPVDESSQLDLGTHRLHFLITPYVHTWEAMLPWDETTRTVFSDVFIGPDRGQAVTEADESDAMLQIYRTVGIFPSRRHLNAALDKIEAAQPTTLACHHGSVKGGRAVAAYLRTLREQDVTGLTEWNPMAEPGT